MGVSTDGQICFGVRFPYEHQFPWGETDDKDIDWWWRNKQGFQHSFEIFTPEGDYIDGQEPSRERINAYFQERDEFDKVHPLPAVELVNYCSGDYEMYILAVANSVMHCSRGCPVTFRPDDLRVTPDEIRVLLKFCKAHGLEYEGEPAWYLSSYWG